MNKIHQLSFFVLVLFFGSSIPGISQKSISRDLDSINCTVHHLKTPFTEVTYTYDTLNQSIRALIIRDDVMTKSERHFFFNSERQLERVFFQSSTDFKIVLFFDSFGLRERREFYAEGATKTWKYAISGIVSEVVEIGKDHIGTRKIYNESNEIVQMILIVDDVEYK